MYFIIKNTPGLILFIGTIILMPLITGCNTQKVAVVEPTEIRTTDTIFVKPKVADEPSAYQHTYERNADLLHTDLHLTFNYAEKTVNGKAKLTFTPVFYPIDQIGLDAKDFTIKEVSISGRPVEYDYDATRLTIDLDKKYRQDEQVDIFIQYIAHPYKGEAGGSAAIVSDRGLYFVDADESDPYKPTQIWTQGETESNSKWFPTIDKPNERCTQKIRVRVKDQYETLSNGLLTDSKKNDDGTRTDTWEMTKPHAPYLFMLAIGDLHRETDVWENIPLEYLVEHDYANDAKKIFNHTPQMLTYFSDILDYKYPWDKYSQVIVRDYVSGAMENTTASLFGQFLQRPMGDLVDNGNDKIVAHELFHQWFGDLVTCESWSNLTLNEGFANYSEYLWLAHKYGKDEGEQHRYDEFQGYLQQANQYAHPLIDFHYKQREDMFDAHSYNKGGLVLHMLREIVGDKAFFAALNHYLNEKKYEAAEVHDLRLAFEEVTGLDLNWFFNQWFLLPGHPIVDMDYKYNPETKFVTIDINQLQKDRDWPLFKIPTQIEIYTTKGNKLRRDILIDKQNNSYHFEIPAAPELVLLDPKKIQLMEVLGGPEPSILLFDKASSVWDRAHAMKALADPESEDREILAAKGMDDAFWHIRQLALTYGGDLSDVQSRLPDIATKDAHANVRLTAINTLSSLDENISAIALNDKSTRVQAAAAMKLNKQDKVKGLAWANKNMNSKSQAVLQAVADIFVDQEEKNKTEFFKKSADRMSFDTSFPFYTTWAGYLVHENPDVIIPQLESWAAQLNSENTGVYKKYAILTALQPLAQYLPMNKYDKETRSKIQSLIQQMGMAAMTMFQ